ncbi:hypothetical protein UA08_05374 [Talaromyces atroroseus]|uniref:DnaJ homologue subfamily C member 28 conserved domain-containing protein n=1 Tax=Talaromyces atroroseus TaxID=1441469 RepID=A0A225AWH2_TALAT|nr:hypothetical protein UA08_05374 [Talaromyces atroroseus]OKL59306.1 hypothetical protein UA08_05374 [Talaromyces atroroseus]
MPGPLSRSSDNKFNGLRAFFPKSKSLLLYINEEASMMGVARSSSLGAQCASCLQAQRRRCLLALSPQRAFSVSPLRRNEKSNHGPENREEGAMSRRLSEMTEDALLQGGRSARRNIQEAGFSEGLKQELEEKIKASTFKSDNAGAFSILNMPRISQASAGKGTRENAIASPWRGTENVEDTTLRMLDDSKKPMRVPYQIPNPTAPVNVNLRPAAKVRHSTGSRLASARDKTQIYALSQSTGLSDKEREEVKKQLTARFEAGARPMPMSINGLASLANERIEDAIAKGQFKNLPRGKGKHTKTDHNANSAFIDTTEYFMNKIIQKQEIVPPWIEKQQDLAREIDRFRQRLRTEWRRHAARLISSHGGSLEDQRRRARGYAAAEARLIQRRKAEFSIASSNAEDAILSSLSQISHDGRISSGFAQPSVGVVSNTAPMKAEAEAAKPPESLSYADESLPHLPPLRDPEYMTNESGWHKLQVKAINDLTRSYNLQAPQLAQKPYLNLERELNACYADVAPSLADEITTRATGRVGTRQVTSTKRQSLGGLVEDMLQTNQRVRLYEEDRSKAYGFKELWRDIWKRGEKKMT